MRPLDRATPCDNLNHRRADPPAGYCPSCGERVNPRIDRRGCTQLLHDAARRDRSTYCVDCGTRLVEDR